VNAANLPMERPLCPSSADHGRCAYRPGRTREQVWCGTWYDCQDPGCHSGYLFPSYELIRQHFEMGATWAQLVNSGATDSQLERLSKERGLVVPS
jgi:hypothetical protein